MTAISKMSCVFCDAKSLGYAEIDGMLTLRCSSCGAVGPIAKTRPAAKKLYSGVASESQNTDVDGIRTALEAAIWNAFKEKHGRPEYRWRRMQRFEQTDYMPIYVYSADIPEIASLVVRELAGENSHIDDAEEKEDAKDDD